MQTLKTLIHETAHALLHARPEAADKDRHTKEVEAESIAYVVCQHFGIDTADYSFPYVTSWSRGRELDELKASLDCISKTASGLITAMEAACPELAADKAEKPKKEMRLTVRRISFNNSLFFSRFNFYRINIIIS